MMNNKKQLTGDFKMELKGKIIDFLGDSITEGVGVVDIENNRYDNVMKKNYGLAEVYNYGIGGSRLAHQSKPSEKPRHDLCFCGRVYDLNRNADIVVVYGGVNDYFHGDAPIGKMGDTTPATFYGAVRFLMEYLTAEFPGKTIVFMSPARFFYEGMDGSLPSNGPKKGPDALPVLGYTAIIKETAELYGIPVLDLFEKLGLDPCIPEIREKYTEDGLHFNDAGQHFIAKCLGEFLLSL